MLYKIKPFGFLVFRILFLLGVLSCGSAQAGTWTAIAHNAPGGLGALLLLPDGTVMAQGYAGTSWYRLTPSSSGSYINGTWTTLAPMHDSRLYFASKVLQDGRVFVAGGEYGSGGSTAEVYDPKTNVWTRTPSSGQDFIDAESEVLPNGNVMVIPVYSGANSYIYNPVLNTWSQGPVLKHGQDEATWLKLPDTSILTIDPGTKNSERYIPSLNSWITDGTLPVSMYSALGEEGGALLLPDKRAVFFGDTGNTAFYTASGGTAAGTWMAGTMLPTVVSGTTTIQLGVPDAPVGMLTTGNVLCAFSQADTYNSPTYFYEFNPTANSGSGAFTAEPAPGSTTPGTTRNSPAYVSTMLALPDGTMVVGLQGSSSFYEYSATGPVVTSGTPAISSITSNTDGSYTLTGTWLNGSSEGACYGDDLQMSTDYPILRLTSGSSVYFAKAYNWSNTAVATGTASETVQFRLTPSMTTGTYAATVIASGIQSPSANFVISSVPAGVSIAVGTGTTTKGSATPASLTITRTGSTTNAMPVTFAVGGSGVQGTDYYLTDSSTNTITNSVTIPAGSASASVKVYGLNNGQAGGSVTAQLAILSGTNYEPATNAYFATTTITNVDVAPAISIANPASWASIPAGVGLVVSGSVVTTGSSYGGGATTLTPTWSQTSGSGTVLFSATNSLTTNATFSGTGIYGLTLSATNSAGQSATPQNLTVVVGSLWANQDLGAAGTAGSFTLNSGTFAIKSYENGGEIDDCQYVYSQVSGNFTATLHQAANGGGSTSWSGLEIRQSLAAGSLGAFLFDSTAATTAEWRTGSSSTYNQSGTRFPWLQLVRNGTTIAFNVSTDGTTWTPYVGGGTSAITQTISSLTDPVYVGVTAYASKTSAVTITYDNVSVTSGTTPGGASLINMGATVSAGTNQSISGNTATLNGTESDDGLPNPPASVTTNWSLVSGPGTIAFGNAASLTMSGSFSTSGTYTLQLTANDGAITTFNNVTYSVSASLPVISAQPVSRTSFAGGGLILSVAVTGANGYQWYENGGLITGATNATLSLNSLSGTSSGNYSVLVSGSGGSVMSGTSTVNVVTPAWWSYEQQVVANNPISYWEMNEASGTSAFDAFGLNNGTYQGNYTLSGSGQPVPPYYGFTSGSTATLFDGSSSAVAISGLNLNSNTVTIAGWINVSGTEANYTGIFFNRVGSSVAGLDISASAANRLGYTWNNQANTYNWNSGLVVPQNQWTFVALAVSASNAVIYMDPGTGLVSATNAIANVTQSFSGATYIGQDSFGGRFFQGSLNQFALFDTTLTPSQIAALDQSSYGETVTIAATTGTTIKGDTANPGVITLTRTGITTNPLTINFTNGGSAVLGNDYNLSSGTSPLTTSVVIPTGTSSATIAVSGIDNGQAGSAVTEQMTLQSGSDYNFGSATSASVTINNNDVNPALSLITPTQAVVTIPNGVGLVLSATANSNGGTYSDGSPTLSPQWNQTSGSGVATFSSANSLTTDATFSGSGTYGLSLSGSNSAGQSLPAQNLTIVVGSPFANQDLGTTGSAGFFTLNSGTLAISNYGSSGEIDDCQYVYVTATGNFVATIHQVANGGMNLSWSGLEIRQNLSAGSPGAFIFDSTAATTGEWRTTTSGTWSQSASHFPWLQLIRNGTTITFNVSTDGTTWSPYVGKGSTAIVETIGSLTDPLYVGATAYAHGSSKVTVTYDHFTITSGTVPGGSSLIANLGPTVSGGTNQAISTGSTTLNGTEYDDGLPNPPAAVTTNWSEISGPGSVTLGNPSALTTSAVFATSGTYTLQLTANDGAITTFNNVTYTVSLAPLSPIQNWTQQTFGANASNSAVSGETVSPSGNGIPNLMSYALNLDPFSNSAVAQLPTVSVSGSNLVIAYRQNDAATDITYTVEESTDLQTWTPVTETPTQVSDDGSTSVMQVSVPMNGQPTLMLHLKITAN